VLSSGTTRLDRLRKMPTYLEREVDHLWLVDPDAKTLEAYRRQERIWILLGNFGEEATARIEPFAEVELDLTALWELGET
jgi:Putative restriction endonuclease